MELIRRTLPDWSYCDGSGYGDGYGDGDDYGSGYGYGNGNGSGSGYGYGYGDVSGYCDSNAYGYSYGDGSGHGNDNGNGHGSDYGYWCSVARTQHPSIIDDPRTIGFWWSDEYGHPSNGGKSSTEAYAGLTQAILGPLGICSAQGLHATLNPPQWQGRRLWIVALNGAVVYGDDKMAALEREILCEVDLG